MTSQSLKTQRAAGAFGLPPRQPDSPRYQRVRDLPRLLPVFAEELETPSPAQQARLLAMLRRALRHERTRGLAGHWTYDLARHAALLNAYRAEQAAAAGSKRS